MELGILIMSLCRVHIDSDLSEVRDWVSEERSFSLFHVVFNFPLLCYLFVF